MIKIENSKLFIENEFDCIIPFEIHINNDLINLNVFDIVQDIAYDYMKLFDDYTSADAIDFLYSKINPIIYQFGYETDLNNLHEWSYLYEMNQVNADLILPNTIKWNSAMKYQNLTSIELDYVYDRNIFITLIDDKIVSYACENPQETDGIIDIGVETVRNYMGNGFAASNAAALALYNQSIGNTVTYTCEHHNIASQHLAEKIGFEKVGKEYYYVCYRR